MSSPQASCPSCAAPLAFRPGTMVSVCSYCKAISARTDRDPKLLGKVADLVDTRSPLRLGMSGSHAGKSFVLAGRTQLKHPLGGFWDEWYLDFGEGRWGWLAEVQGRFLLSFRLPLAQAPALEGLEVGAEIELPGQGRWTVGERSEAAFHAAEGEIPWAVELGATYPYADLSGRNGAFATLDYSEEPPLFFSGRETGLEELRLAPPSSSGPSPRPRLKAMNLNCPKCGGPLTLHAPDETERVGCPSCGALLDASGGRLLFLKSLKKPHGRMFIPLGTEGTLRGRKVTCIGHLLKSCTVDGLRYPWTETLLMQENGTFLWLVESDGHWNLAEGVPPGEVHQGSGGREVQFKGQSFRRYQESEAVVEGVWGECTWKVEAGEKARVAEFIQPPLSLAEERQKHKGGGEEVNWSLSSYLEAREVWEAFKLQGAPPTAGGICPNMPNPHRALANRLGRWMLAAFAVLFALIAYELATHRERVAFDEQIELVAQPKPTPGEGGSEQVYFSKPFRINESRKNLEIRMRAPVENTWLAVDGALVNEETGLTEAFELSTSYYHGVDGGESWSEGSRTASLYMSAVPPGTYTLRLVPQWEGPTPPVRAFQIDLRVGIFRTTFVFLAIVGILIGPVIQWLRSSSFEGRRWADSMFPGGLN